MSSDRWGACPGCGAEMSRENASRLPGGAVVHVGCAGSADHPSSMRGDRAAPAPLQAPRPRRMVGLGRRSPAKASSEQPPAEVPDLRIGDYSGSDAVPGLLGRPRDPRGAGVDERTEMPRYPGGTEMSLQTCATLGIGLATREEAKRQARPGDEIVEPPPIAQWCRACSLEAMPQLGPVLTFGSGKYFHPGCAAKMLIDPRSAAECSLVEAFAGLLSRFIEWWASEEPEDDSTPEEDDEDDEDDDEKAREELNKRQLAALAEPPPLRAHNRPAAPQTLEPGREIHVFESTRGPLWSSDGPLEARCGLRTTCGGRDLEWTVLAMPADVSTSNDSTSVDSRSNVSTSKHKVGFCAICARGTTARGGGTPYPAFVAPSQILRPDPGPPPRISDPVASWSQRARRLR